MDDMDEFEVTRCLEILEVQSDRWTDRGMEIKRRICSYVRSNLDDLMDAFA